MYRSQAGTSVVSTGSGIGSGGVPGTENPIRPPPGVVTGCTVGLAFIAGHDGPYIQSVRERDS